MVEFLDGLPGAAIHFFDPDHGLLDLVLGGQGEGHVLGGHLIDGAFGGLDRDLHVGEQAADLLAEMAGPPGQVAHLVGDHGETAPGFAGPGRFDGGVERQQVGLLGNTLDLAEHAFDFAHLGHDAVGQLDQSHGDAGVFDDAIDKAAQGLRSLGGKGLEFGDGIAAAGRFPFVAAGDDLQAQLLLPLNLPVHAVETVDQLADGFGKDNLGPADLAAHDFDLLAVLAGDAGQGAGAEVRELALGPRAG